MCSMRGHRAPGGRIPFRAILAQGIPLHCDPLSSWIERSSLPRRRSGPRIAPEAQMSRAAVLLALVGGAPVAGVAILCGQCAARRSLDGREVVRLPGGTQVTIRHYDGTARR